MKPRLLLLLLMLGLCVCCAGTATAQTKRIDLSDLQKLVNLSDPQIAPDGKSIACIVSRVNWTDDRFDANLVLVDIASGTQRTLTYDRKGIAAPPDPGRVEPRQGRAPRPTVLATCLVARRQVDPVHATGHAAFRRRRSVGGDGARRRHG